MNKFISIFLVQSICAGLFFVFTAQASESGSAERSDVTQSKPGELYLPSSDSMADLNDALESARENDKLALVIMGANWCHDSRALASRIHTEPLSSLVNEHYETIFVDVGYLDKGRDVITSLGEPIFYATPTVLIIDPVSGQLLNAENRHQWGNAYNISMEESVAYFEQMAKPDLTDTADNESISTTLQSFLWEIEAFELIQAERLYTAYEILSPMLKAYKEGDKNAFSEEYWNEVRGFRLQVPLDMDALRNEAIERVTTGETGIQLDYPEYPAFSWEADSP